MIHALRRAGFAAACVSLVGFAEAAAAPAAAAPASGYDPLALFAPLQLPQPASAYRSGGGVPGPLYWQNRADYDLHASIDPATRTLSGQETITYSNRSPDTLDVLWLQLDQTSTAPTRAPAACARRARSVRRRHPATATASPRWKWSRAASACRPDSWSTTRACAWTCRSRWPAPARR
jgi:hypothetical protein